jgi:hypothetical protein
MTAETLWSFDRVPDRHSGTAQWTQLHKSWFLRDVEFNRVVEVASPRPISTGRLHTLLCFHLRPINPVVYWGPYQVNPVGNLILKQASRLDAFSGYPFRT